MKKEKRYFIEIVIKDSETLEPVRSVSTGSDYPESLFVPPVDHRIAKEVNGCLGILFSVPLTKKEMIELFKTNNSKYSSEQLQGLLNNIEK